MQCTWSFKEKNVAVNLKTGLDFFTTMTHGDKIQKGDSHSHNIYHFNIFSLLVLPTGLLG